MNRTLIIAEAGVNHNGSVERALELVAAAARAGADAVKFQTFRSEAVVSVRARKAEYQAARTGAEESQLEMVRKLELDAAAHRALVERSAELGIEFMSTPFDEGSLDLLLGLGVRRIKVPSGEITNGPFLLRLARTRLPLIVSTGMSSLGEVEEALAVLSFGYRQAEGEPVRAKFRAQVEEEPPAYTGGQLTLLHCTTEYPSPPAEANLAAMATLRSAFGHPVGLSDHTPGIAVAIAAVALGAVVVEKHLTLDRGLPGPDHAASLEPDAFGALVAGIRDVEQALGSGRKVAQPSERKNLPIARRSLVATRAIRAGEVFTEANLGCKRPGDGRSPMEYWAVLGTTAVRNYAADEQV